MVRTFFRTDSVSEVITSDETPSNVTQSQFELRACFHKIPAAYSCRTRSPTQLLSCYLSSSLELHSTTTITISASIPEPLASQAASYGLLPTPIMPPGSCIHSYIDHRRVMYVLSCIGRTHTPMFPSWM